MKQSRLPGAVCAFSLKRSDRYPVSGLPAGIYRITHTTPVSNKWSLRAYRYYLQKSNNGCNVFPATVSGFGQHQWLRGVDARCSLAL